MRKLALVGIVVALMAAVSAPVVAGGIGVLAGYWDTKDAGDDQGGGVKLEIDCGKAIEFVVRATFLDGFSQVDQGKLFEIEAVPLDLGFAYNFQQGEKVNPYIGVGGTYLFIKPDAAVGEEPTSRPRSQEEFGYYGELGVEFQVSERVAFFIEGLYRQVKGEVRGNDLGTAPQVDFQTDFAGGAANIGILYRW